MRIPRLSSGNPDASEFPTSRVCRWWPSREFLVDRENFPRLLPHHGSRSAGARDSRDDHQLDADHRRAAAGISRVADGVDIRIIQRMLGHASIQQMQRYLNVTDEELRKGLEVSWGRPLRAVSGE